PCPRGTDRHPPHDPTLLGLSPHQFDGDVAPAEYRVRGRAPEYVRPVAGVSYDAVPTERLEKAAGGARAADS
ncbi:hypothetical protein ACFWAN_50640, partial [Streptomyces mirabilis]